MIKFNFFLLVVLLFPILSLAQKENAQEKKDNVLPEISLPGEGAYLSGEFIYTLDNKPTPQCHASTIVETKKGLVVAFFADTLNVL